MKVLVHVCCAPCYGHVHRRLEGDGHEVAGLFYNPNIHPYEEYRRRLHAAQRYAYLTKADIRFIDEYDVEAWVRGALASIDSGKKRCDYCYELRLERAAAYAGENGFDAFTTTLLASTHQDHEAIRRACEAAAARHGVQFAYEDFRTGKKESYQISKELDIYRQGYCGCIFSEEERHLDDERRQRA